MILYDNAFYNQIDEGAMQSARIILPYVLELFKPRSIIDIGCGSGAWLHAIEEQDMLYAVHGVDGRYNNSHSLGVDFESHDLTIPYIPPYRYDLAITLEVAEHMDEQHADTFVKSVSRCSDNILWSAAVPGQNGVNHVNEQFPSYWVPKFEELGYKCNGEFRYQFWYDERIENWYRQNVLLFSKNFDWNEPVRDLIHYNNYPNYGGDVEERFKYE